MIKTIKKPVIALLTAIILLATVIVMPGSTFILSADASSSTVYKSPAYDVDFSGRSIQMNYEYVVETDPNTRETWAKLTGYTCTYSGKTYNSLDALPFSNIGYADNINYNNPLIPRIVGNKMNCYTVGAIGDMLFKGQSCLESIVIPKSVRKIEMWAFAQCLNLKTVTFESGSMLKETYYGIFVETQVKELALPSGVTSIDGAPISAKKSNSTGCVFDDSKYLAEESNLLISVETAEAYSDLRTTGYSGKIKYKNITTLPVTTNEIDMHQNPGFYFIRNVGTGEYITLKNPYEANSSIKTEKFTGEAWQIFGIKEYRIFSRHLENTQGTYKVFDLVDGKTNNETRIQMINQHSYDDPENNIAQRFNIIKAGYYGEPSYYITSEKSQDKYLTDDCYKDTDVYIRDQVNDGKFEENWFFCRQEWVFEQVVAWN